MRAAERRRLSPPDSRPKYCLKRGSIIANRIGSKQGQRGEGEGGGFRATKREEVCERREKGASRLVGMVVARAVVVFGVVVRMVIFSVFGVFVVGVVVVAVVMIVIVIVQVGSLGDSYRVF